jgi:hypothetical protein
MKNTVTMGAFCIMITALFANSAWGQLTLDSSSPSSGFDVIVSEGNTLVFSVVVSGSATPTYTWVLNGVELDRPNSPTFTLAPDLEFVQDRFNGDRFGIHCTVTAGEEQVEPSWIVVVQDANRAPSIGTILLQASPQGRSGRFADLEVYVREGAPSDPDAEDGVLFYQFLWSNGETSVVDGPKAASSSTLDALSYTSEGDVWNCTVSVADALNAVSADSIISNEFRVNTLPVTGTPQLDFDFPFARTDNFIGYIPEIRGLPDDVTDADPEDQPFLQYRYQWYVDNSPLVYGPFYSLDLINDAYPGATVHLEVIPSDSYDEGVPAKSASIVIGQLFEITVDVEGTQERVEFGFFEGASLGEDQFDSFGGVYLNILDTPDLNTASYFGRYVVPPSTDQIFNLFLYDSGQDATLSWQDQPFPGSHIYMYEVNEKGRIISDTPLDLTQPGSMTLATRGGGSRFFQVRVLEFTRPMEFQKLRRGWNLIAPSQVLDPTSIAPATGIGGTNFGLAWNSEQGMLESTEEFVPLEGCWLHSRQGGVAQFIGQPANPAVLNLKAGWNLIGVPNAISAPTGSKYLSPFWGWDGSFRAAQELLPGQAYWINVSEALEMPVAP